MVSTLQSFVYVYITMTTVNSRDTEQKLYSKHLHTTTSCIETFTQNTPITIFDSLQSKQIHKKQSTMAIVFRCSCPTKLKTASCILVSKIATLFTNFREKNKLYYVNFYYNLIQKKYYIFW